jgi:hypothetical protein
MWVADAAQNWFQWATSKSIYRWARGAHTHNDYAAGSRFYSKAASTKFDSVFNKQLPNRYRWARGEYILNTGNRILKSRFNKQNSAVCLRGEQVLAVNAGDFMTGLCIVDRCCKQHDLKSKLCRYDNFFIQCVSWLGKKLCLCRGFTLANC